MKTDIQQYDPESDRECGACGHAVSHDYPADLGLTCSTRMTDGEPYVGDGCRHNKYSKKCDEELRGRECWQPTRMCECTEEKRLQADHEAQIRELSAQLDDGWPRPPLRYEATVFYSHEASHGVLVGVHEGEIVGLVVEPDYADQNDRFDYMVRELEVTQAYSEIVLPGSRLHPTREEAEAAMREGE